VQASTSKSHAAALVCGLLVATTCGIAAADDLPDNLDCLFKGRVSENTFPKEALTLGLEGRVLIDVDLAKDGSIVNPVVVSSDPTAALPNAFDESALNLVRRFRCKPRAPSVLGLEQQGRYRISVVFEKWPGGVLLAHPASDKQFRIMAEKISPRPPKDSATRISRPPPNNRMQRSGSS
jgi:TonB family protein